MLTHEQVEELRDEYEQDIHRKWMELTKGGLLDDRVHGIRAAFHTLEVEIDRLLTAEESKPLVHTISRAHRDAEHIAKRSIVEAWENRLRG